MKYNEVNFTIEPFCEDYSDILSGLLADIGFETFVATDKGIIGYIQQNVFSKNAIDEIISYYPIEHVKIDFSVQEAPDENWNQNWEENGFKPIIIDNEIAVHTNRHSDIPCVNYDILIHPCQAFGTGSHQTTRLILKSLSQMNLSKKFIVDAGTGTGILSIMAMKCNAAKVLAYDIDEWSVNNAKSNLQLNDIKENVTILHGSAEVLLDVKGVDLLIANINRNILINDLPVFAKTLNNEALLILSGFYIQDIPMLEELANKLGLKLKEKRTEDEWAMLLFESNATSRMNV